MQNKVKIKEIFKSVQGEGPYIGYNQLFIRFSKCNLKCKYCDTDFKSNLIEYSTVELADIVNKSENIHSVSLTGGEPLLDVDFLQEFLPLTNKKIYLETNGTLYQNLEKIINYIDIISMDIKLNSSSKNGDLFDLHNKFIETAMNAKKEIFIKVVFDEKITDEEIKKAVNCAEKYDIQIILQPKTDGECLKLKKDLIEKVYNKFLLEYKNVRLIPQTHKFLNIK